MADVKISGLPAASAALGAMELESNNAGTSEKVTVNQLDSLLLGTTNGLIARTGTNTRAARTITAGTGAVVSNGNGVSGNPTIAVDVGTTANKIVQLNGSGELPAVSGANLTGIASGIALISTQTVTSASPVAAVDFTGIDGTYDAYIVMLHNVVPVTDNTSLYLRTSSDGGSTFDAGASDYWEVVASGNSNTGVSQITIQNFVGSETNENGVSATIDISTPAADSYTAFRLAGINMSAFNRLEHHNRGAVRLSNAPVNALRFYFSSGNIESGIFRLYGMAKS
jgi:hypothetical protein